MPELVHGRQLRGSVGMVGRLQLIFDDHDRRV
jgi:hypothetical protein